MNAPLLPNYVNLRDFQFMPLDVDRLRRSKQWVVAKRRPDIGFYSVNLWMACWHELPAGSIEDDDDVLADAAMCHPDKWPEVRELVLRGWVKCIDGRLYHPVVCEKAATAWNEKAHHRWRRECDRVRKDNIKRKEKELPERPFPEEPAPLSVGIPEEGAGVPEISSGIPENSRLKGEGEGKVRDRESKGRGKGQGQGQGQGNINTPLTGSGRARKARRLPPDWSLPIEYREWARKKGFSENEIDRQAARMLNWSLSTKHGVKLDWYRAWQNWLDDSPSQPRASPSAQQSNGNAGVAERFLRRHGDIRDGNGSKESVVIVDSSISLGERSGPGSPSGSLLERLTGPQTGSDN